MYKQVKVRKSKVKVFVLPTTVSISRVIWNLPTYLYLIILQTQKRKIVNKQPKKRKKRKKGKKKKEKKTII